LGGATLKVRAFAVATRALPPPGATFAPSAAEVKRRDCHCYCYIKIVG